MDLNLKYIRSFKKKKTSWFQENEESLKKKIRHFAAMITTILIKITSSETFTYFHQCVAVHLLGYRLIL